MQLERTFRDGGDLPASEAAGETAPRTRDYRREAADCDAQLRQSLGQLADLYRAADVVNHGAQ
ncbi:MAG: hypothetical protein ABSG86_26275 [Thermoguttaceae bacterium]|jgi:hypothetical protein